MTTEKATSDKYGRIQLLRNNFDMSIDNNVGPQSQIGSANYKITKKGVKETPQWKNIAFK